jgi:hypothetical protein
MSPRLILGLTVVAVVIGCAALVAPVPRGAGKQRLYFPTTVGTEWVYETDSGREYTDYLTKAERADGATVVTVERCADGRHQSSKTIRVSADGLFELENDHGKYDPPGCMLKLPFKADDRWKGYLLPRNRDPACVNIAVTEEKVEVPAGTFTAIRVDTEVTRDGKTRTLYTHWYAPDVGLVKYDTGNFIGNRGVMVLKAFKLGEE